MPLRRRPIARLAVGTAVVGGTAAVVGGRAARRQAATAPAPAPEAAPAAAPGPDPVAQLKDLAALKDSGALTQAEFDSEKAKILG